ncbi:hypothetical protein NEOLI_003645 [Neolecta irregularis DAH-3]|uniref:Inositol-pentakisphosphate 2-kinase n=1 Tax=Neolecta irregularis (strain DAH-3) TaxID=1198029 RepID=A0A1U7LSK9_NEOID|nr:hypothetical protein NEOLI_003645 [Neolecta irregularis DAH-3]|eukprot:OLL25655.1 hypothetical protein NEOLI_003645 [Neolecta irregularis DAH-3]
MNVIGQGNANILLSTPEHDMLIRVRKDGMNSRDVYEYYRSAIGPFIPKEFSMKMRLFRMNREMWRRVKEAISDMDIPAIVEEEEILMVEDLCRWEEMVEFKVWQTRGKANGA